MERRGFQRPGEAGFLLIEAVVAVALVALVAGAALAAVIATTRAAARALPAAALTSTAQNVLTDLRAATAYDPDGLAALAGKSIAFESSEARPDGSSRQVHVEAAVARSARTDAFIGTVTARDADGTAVTLQATLVAEAPAPGAVVPLAPTPPPAADSAATAADADTIAL